MPSVRRRRFQWRLRRPSEEAAVAVVLVPGARGEAVEVAVEEVSLTMTGMRLVRDWSWMRMAIRPCGRGGGFLYFWDQPHCWLEGPKIYTRHGLVSFLKLDSIFCFCFVNFIMLICLVLSGTWGLHEEGERILVIIPGFVWESWSDLQQYGGWARPSSVIFWPFPNFHHAYIQALAERWFSDTQSKHPPIGELVIIPNDWFMILGIRFGDREVEARDHSRREAADLLGLRRGRMSFCSTFGMSHKVNGLPQRQTNLRAEHFRGLASVLLLLYFQFEF